MNDVKRFKACIDELDEMELGDWVGIGAISVVAASDYDALLAERDTLKADAERYRWLRGGGHQLINFDFIIERCGGEDGLDRAIDKARSPERDAEKQT